LTTAVFTPDGASALAVLSLRGVLPLSGPWAFEVELDATAAETPLKGARATLNLIGRRFSGYIAEVAPWAGRVRLFFEAGAGGMRTVIPAQGYSSALVSTLAAAMVADAGEVLAQELPPEVVLEHYDRAEAPGATALSILTTAQSLGWRFNDDGHVRIAPETWPAADELGALEMEPDGSDASTEIAPLLPSFSPGMTWRNRRIERVVYRLPEGESLLARLVFERSLGGDMKGLFERAVRRAVSELIYAKRWPCSVVSQDAAGRLELQPDDALMAGTPAIPVLLGLPGARVEVPATARVGLVHEGADPSRPRALGWEQGTPASKIYLDAETLIALAGGTKGVHRIDDHGIGGTFVPSATGYDYHDADGNPLWSVSATAAGNPVVFVFAPLGDPSKLGQVITKAVEGSAIVKAGG
jgi:hypothetical protein